MPTLKRYQPSQVKLQPVPDVRVSPNAPLEAFGGGPSAEAVQTATRGALSDFQKIALEEKQKTDDVASLDLDSQLSGLQTNLEVKAKEMRGKDAAGVIDFVNTEWQKGIGEVSKNAKNREQQLAVDKFSKARYANLNRTVQLHIADERKTQDKTSTYAYVENARNEGVLNAANPERVTLSIYQQIEAFLGFAKRNGFGDDETKNKIAEIKSDTHSAIIDTLIGSRQIDQAKAYYEKHKEELVNADLRRLTPKYLEAQATAIEKQKSDEQKRIFTTNENQVMLDYFDGKINLSEAQRLFRNKTINRAFYNSLEGKLISSEYELWRRRITREPDQNGKVFLSDPAVFNRIRELQLGGETSKDELQKMIMETEANALTKEDSTYLTQLTKEMPMTPREQKISGQVRQIRAFANRYLSRSYLGFEKGKESKQADTENLVREFLNRVDNEKADKERINEITLEVTKERIHKEYPEISKWMDLPHIAIEVGKKVHQFFEPDRKTKLKPQYKLTITRTKIAEEEPKP